MSLSNVMGVLNVSTVDTAPKPVRVQQGGVALNLTGYSIECKIQTSPVTTRTCAVVEADLGTMTCSFGSLPAGTYVAAFYLTNADGLTMSDMFTLNVRSGI